MIERQSILISGKNALTRRLRRSKLVTSIAIGGLATLAVVACGADAVPAAPIQPMAPAPAPTAAPLNVEPIRPAPPAQPAPAAPAPTVANTYSIVNIATSDGRFNTLVTALSAAGLVETLQGEGPFTVFAPTDDAFDKLPDGAVEDLLQNRKELTDILLYHVVSGDVKAADVVALDSAKTLQGQSVSIRVMDSKVMINDAEVVITDIEAANGTIHVIDSVIIPPQEVAMSIVDIAAEDGRFSTLVAALQAADLVGALEGEGPYTVFAPTDEAFGKLPEGTVEALLQDIPALTNILLYHVVSGDVKAADVVALDSAKTLQGQSVSIRVMDGKVMINDAEVVITDIEASNGTIHVIDSVILPEETT